MANNDLLLEGNVSCLGLLSALNLLEEQGFDKEPRLRLYFTVNFFDSTYQGTRYEDPQNIASLSSYLQRAVQFLDSLRTLPDGIDRDKVQSFLTTPLHFYQKALGKKKFRVGYRCGDTDPNLIDERFNKMLHPISPTDLQAFRERFALSEEGRTDLGKVPGGQIISGAYQPNSSRLIILVADAHGLYDLQADVLRLTQHVAQGRKAAFVVETEPVGQQIEPKRIIGNRDVNELRAIYDQSGRDLVKFFEALTARFPGPPYHPSSGYRSLWLRNLAIMVAYNFRLPPIGIATHDAPKGMTLRDFISRWLGEDSPFLQTIPSETLDRGDPFEQKGNEAIKAITAIHNRRSLDMANNLGKLIQNYDLLIVPLGSAHIGIVADKLMQNTPPDTSFIVVLPDHFEMFY